MANPSTSASNPLKPAARAVACFRSSANPPGKPSPAANAFPMGKNSIRPAGMVQCRKTGGGAGGEVKKVPARNHTLPDCPTEQFAPVVSRTGLKAGGGSYAHLNHLALHSPYVRPFGAEFGGRTPGLGFPGCAGARTGPSSAAITVTRNVLVRRPAGLLLA